jgi:hypothetical protein
MLGRPGGDRGVVRAAVSGPAHPASPVGSPFLIEPERPGESGVDRALRAWALFTVGRPDHAYGLLRRHMADGLGNGAGVWPESGTAGRESLPGDIVAAALVPAVFVHGLLGARAEAPWGRLRLGPALPARWSSLEVTGIRVADARIGLSYAREQEGHVFTLLQVAGRVPLTVVFEPAVPGKVHRVRVDGGSADLTPERTGGRSRIRLQLPLDAERRVTLVSATG